MTYDRGMVVVNWKRGMVFEADTPTGAKFRMDAYPEEGELGEGPTPLEAFLSALAACGAMDVIGILQKKRQTVTGYRIEVEGERPQPGTWPRPYTSLVIRHIVSGENLNPEAVARAVELSDEKYCSVLATLRERPPVTSEWRIE